jgi:hypothetical protein
MQQLTTVTQAARSLGVPMTTLRKRLFRERVAMMKLGSYRLVCLDDARRVMQPVTHLRGIGEANDDNHTNY